MKINLSVTGLYNYDNSIFDTFHIPESIDIDQLKTQIFIECSEFPTTYPDPVLFKSVLDKWSLIKLPLWERMVRAAEAEYDLLHNYDRTETENITTTGREESSRTDTGTSTDTGTRTTGGQDGRTITDNGTRTNTGTQTTRDAGEGTDTEAATGYNSSTMVDTGRTEHSHDDSIQRTDNLTEAHSTTILDNLIHNSTDTINSSGTTSLSSEGDISRSGATSRTVRAYGNIGVTTNQQMLKSEIDLIPELDVYAYIVSDFIDVFCVGVY